MGFRRPASRPSRSNRPERKNPLTFESYAELRDMFRALVYDADGEGGDRLTGAGGNFCSGGDVHEIIGAADRRWTCRACSSSRA